jgi:hypothetical protein
MIATIAMVLICQFKTDDAVYVKSAASVGYLTEKLARVRYVEPFGYSVPSSQIDTSSGGVDLTVRWPKYTQVKVIAVRFADGDRLVRVHHAAWKQSYWYHAEDLSPWTKGTEVQAESDMASDSNLAKMDETLKKLSPYIKSQNERAAISAAFASGLNPLSMTAKEAAVLTTGQRRSISTVRQRFTKGNRVNDSGSDM